MDNKVERRVFIVSIVISFVLAGVIFLLDPLLDKIILLPDAGPAWYYWKLPNPTIVTRLSAWSLYAFHQIVIWIMIKKGVGKKKRDPQSSNQIKILLVNFVFIVLHIVQTHIFYDGLAQDVPVWSSQYSVIGMLILTLILLIPKRGFILGKKIPIQKEVMQFIRKYHGYYISWALVYTFWFHPTEGDLAILIGFFYMFLLFIQMSSFRAKIHQNIVWQTVLEIFVVVHGTAIAFMNAQEVWPMFLFGFLFMFVFTYQYGLKLNLVVRVLIFLIFLIGLFGTYYFFREFKYIYELAFIPATFYIGGLVLPLLLKLFFLNKRSES